MDIKKLYRDHIYYWYPTRKLRDLKYWVRYRTTDRYHVIRCDGLGPGYHEIEDQMLHSMFGLLRSYVEDQCAHMYKWCGCPPMPGASKKELGLAYLNANPHKKEVMDLYRWWVEERPSRPEPMDASGFSAVWAKRKDEERFEKTENGLYRMRFSEEESAASRLSNEIEERYHADDEAMMKRLIAIRRSLWT
jgi:hypothetical protein